MAHELKGARSLLLLRSTRDGPNGDAQSSIVFNYGHTTIPRHLRDIVVTEYGVADLRGRTDAETAAALISIADARFQPELARRAQAAGKLPGSWHLPDDARANTPERLATSMAPLASRGALPLFPLGTDFDDVERRIVPALMWLKRGSAGWRAKLRLAAAAASATASPSDAAIYERLGLSAPPGLREVLLRRLVAAGLAGARS